MRETYFAVCKCRLCGKTYISGETSCNATELAILILQEHKGPCLHHCEGGGIGIADFLGFKRKKEEPPCSN